MQNRSPHFPEKKTTRQNNGSSKFTFFFFNSALLRLNWHINFKIFKVSIREIWWASLVVQLVKNLPAMQETQFDSWIEKIHWRRDRLPTPVFLSLPGGSTGRESAHNVGSNPGLQISPEEGNGYPLQDSGLENSKDCIAVTVRHNWATFTTALQTDSLPSELQGSPK